MITTTTDMLTSLPDQFIVTSSWEVFVEYILVQKLDKYNMNRWHEELKASKQMPTFDQVREFLEIRKKIIKTYDYRRRSTTNPNHQYTANPKTIKTMITQISNQPSMICLFIILWLFLVKITTKITNVQEFTQADLSKRFQMVRKKQLCQNYLFSHATTRCKSPFNNRTSEERHQSMLNTTMVNDTVST